MSRNLRFVLAMYLCVGWAAVAAAQTNALEPALVDRAAAIASAAAVTREAFPDADDVLIDDSVRIRYRADGTSETWDDEYVKVLTEKGKRDRQTLSLHFDLAYETAEVRQLEIIKPDGRIVPVDVAQQSRVMVDQSQMGMNIYNPNDKVLQVSVPGLDIGDVCRTLSHRVTTKARVPDTWSDYSVLEYTAPFRRLTYEVIGPKDRPLVNVALRDEVAGTVKASRAETPEGIRYRWEVKDVPRMFEEPGMPPTYTVVQRLLVSTIPDWQTISRWYWNLCLPRLEATTPEMKAKVDELVRDVPARSNRIGRVFQFVSQQIRYMGITTEKEAPGYEPHDVKLTFQNRYGVCRDKAALLVAMLRMADVPAYPVLIHTGPRKDEQVPQPYFNHAVVAAEAEDGSYVLMDPTDENTKELFPSYLCNKSYLVAHPKGERLRTSPIVPATENLLTIRSAGRLDASGTLSMESTLEFAGINDNAYRGHFSQLKPAERRRFFEGRLKDRIPGARLTAFAIEPENMLDVSRPLSVRLAYEAPDFPVRGESVAMLPLPWLGTSIGYVNFVLGQTGLERRRYTLETDIACGVRETFRIELGDAVGAPIDLPAYPPVATNLVVFQPRVTAVSNVLEGSGTFLLPVVEYSPAEYLVLKQALKDIEYARRMRPVFGAAAGAEYDVHVLSDRTEFALADSRNWTSVQTVAMKILTYAGKKRFSEIKFAYNPTWAEVKIASAMVTGADGTVHKVMPAEMNLMDAGWVGTAPRYPAEKTLVVSLPGVDVGAVIEYRVEQTARGVPFFSVNKPFRGFEPADRVSLAIDAPASLPLALVDTTAGASAFRRVETNDRVRLEWDALRPPPVPKEDGLPPWWSFTPTVLVSAGDWAGYAREVKDRLMAAAAGQKQAAAKARDLTRACANDTERLVAIRDYVARFVRPAGPGLPALPLTCVTPADRTLAEGYGNTTDRAVALFAMLREAGFKPEFVLASSGGPRAPRLCQPLLDAPQRALFDSVLVRVAGEAGPVYLNDTDQYAEPGSTPLDRRPALELDGRPTAIAALPGLDDGVEIDYIIDLAETGDALVTVSTTFLGMDHAGFHRLFAELPPEETRRLYRELIASLSQAAEPVTDLINEYERYPGRQFFSVRVPRMAVRSGDFLHLLLPSDAGMFLRLTADRRANPLLQGGALQRGVTYRIRLPASAAEASLLPQDVQLEAPGGLVAVDWKSRLITRPDGAKVVEVVQRLRLEPGVYPPEAYPTLLEMDRRMKHPRAATLLVRIGGALVKPVQHTIVVAPVAAP